MKPVSQSYNLKTKKIGCNLTRRYSPYRLGRYYGRKKKKQQETILTDSRNDDTVKVL